MAWIAGTAARSLVHEVIARSVRVSIVMDARCSITVRAAALCLSLNMIAQNAHASLMRTDHVQSVEVFTAVIATHIIQDLEQPQDHPQVHPQVAQPQSQPQSQDQSLVRNQHLQLHR